mmetsp:Transcript_5608/g.14010  ORF Transcript_5608/g.14010 Transcript_5608/m.14010 type:complete len:214 (+) Transcript_5608:1248-1889(+)
MVRQKLHPRNSPMTIQSMYLCTILVVNINILLLAHRHHAGAVQETSVPYRILHEELRFQRQRMLIDHAHVTAPSRQQRELPGPIVPHLIGTIILEIDIVHVPRHGLVQMLVLELPLRQLDRLLHVVLGLDQPRAVGVQDILGVRGRHRVLQSLRFPTVHLTLQRRVRLGPSLVEIFDLVGREVGRVPIRIVLLQVLETGLGELAASFAAVEVG